MFYGVLDLKSHLLEYVNAGHCPPILRHGDGAIEVLGPTRPVLGLLKQQVACAERIQLRSGDAMALYTDGITEATDESGEEFGSERLRDLLADDEAQPLQQKHALILQSVRNYASGKLTDDATLLLVSVRGSEAIEASSASSSAFSYPES
jgi:serine phosphatase RsbU (regulator of sigma subunit)